MNTAFITLLEGVIASLIAVAIVTAFNFFRTRLKNHKLKTVLGIHNKSNSLIILSRRDKELELVGYRDAYASAYVFAMLNEIDAKCEFFLEGRLDVREGDKTEFCIGGPPSNMRTLEYLKSKLPGIKTSEYDKDESIGIFKRWSFIVNNREYKFPNSDNKDFGILAKIAGSNDTSVFLFAGLTGFSTLGSAYFLVSQARKNIYTRFKAKPFCLILQLDAPWSLGIKNVHEVFDASALAFGTIR